MRYRTLNILRKKLSDNINDRILFPTLKDNKEIILEFNEGKDNRVHFELLDDNYYFKFPEEISYLDSNFTIRRPKTNVWNIFYKTSEINVGYFNDYRLSEPIEGDAYINPLELKLKGSIIRKGNFISFNFIVKGKEPDSNRVIICKKGSENSDGSAHLTFDVVPIKITLEEI